MVSTTSLFDCLKHNKEQDNFDKGCMNIIVLREQLRAKGLHLYLKYLISVVEFLMFLILISLFIVIN